MEKGNEEISKEKSSFSNTMRRNLKRNNLPVSEEGINTYKKIRKERKKGEKLVQKAKRDAVRAGKATKEAGKKKK